MSQSSAMQSSIQLLLSADREKRLLQVKKAFPRAKGVALSQHWAGGRAAAFARLAQVDAVAYARSRNHLQGAVTGLSPYLRFGCVDLKTALDSVGQRFGKQAIKLMAELAYRDYFRQVWYRFGDAILQDMEQPKVALGRQPVPAFLGQAFTGLVCMDEIVLQLQRYGYVHNHARLWLAAYVVHWLKVDWKAAADWFEAELLDGDVASNHLSWQWVASSFSNKPYYFNRDNLQHFGGEAWCARCHVRCPFNQDYAQLQQALFTAPENTLPNPERIELPATPIAQDLPAEQGHAAAAVVWVHDEMLSPEHPLLINQTLPAVFVFDRKLYAHWSLKRVQFMADCLAEMPNVQVWLGDTADVLTKIAAGRVLTQQTPQTRLKQAVASLDVVWQAEPRLHTAELTEHDLMRFSRYWKKVAPQLVSHL